MHPLADRVVRRVLEGGGTIPLPDAFADLAELERLAQATSKRAEPRFSEISAPIFVQNEAFYPPTVGALAWARHLAEQYPLDTHLAELALLYALTSKDARALPADPQAARSTVERWARRSMLTLDDAREILQLLFPPHGETEAGVKLAALRMEHGDDVTKWPDAAAREAVACWLETAKAAESAADDRSVFKSIIFSVMREFGGTLDYWIFEASLDHLLAAADELLKRQEAELAAERRVKGSPAAERWLVEAQERFTIFARAFERKYGRATPRSAPHPGSLSPVSEARSAGAP